MSRKRETHLLFESEFSNIWKEVLPLCQLVQRGVTTWSVEFHWTVSRLKGKALINIYHLAFSMECIYISDDMERTEQASRKEVLGCIKEAVGLRLAGVRNITSAANSSLCNTWGQKNPLINSLPRFSINITSHFFFIYIAHLVMFSYR